MARATWVLATAAALFVTGKASAHVASTASGGSERSPQSARGSQVVKRMPTLEERVISAINDFRRSRGLAPLRPNAELASAARAHSLSMAQLGYFDHSSAVGTPFWYRIKSKYPGARYWRVGENLAWAAPNMSAALALSLWANSPPHLRNLLSRAWRDVGVGGVFVSPGPGVYDGLAATILTADFGVRR